MSYYFNRRLPGFTFDEAVERTKEALNDEGFGVLTEIDVQATLKKKIGVGFKKYLILGACHPPSAYKALSAEDKIGVFLPCNVIVEEHEDGMVEVAAVDPIASMMSVKNESLGEVAMEVQARLKKVIGAL